MFRNVVGERPVPRVPIRMVADPVDEGRDAGRLRVQRDQPESGRRRPRPPGPGRTDRRRRRSARPGWNPARRSGRRPAWARAPERASRPWSPFACPSRLDQGRARAKRRGSQGASEGLSPLAGRPRRERLRRRWDRTTPLDPLRWNAPSVSGTGSAAIAGSTPSGSSDAARTWGSGCPRPGPRPRRSRRRSRHRYPAPVLPAPASASASATVTSVSVSLSGVTLTFTVTVTVDGRRRRRRRRHLRRRESSPDVSRAARTATSPTATPPDCRHPRSRRLSVSTSPASPSAGPPCDDPLRGLVRGADPRLPFGSHLGSHLGSGIRRCPGIGVCGSPWRAVGLAAIGNHLVVLSSSAQRPRRSAPAAPRPDLATPGSRPVTPRPVPRRPADPASRGGAPVAAHGPPDTPPPAARARPATPMPATSEAAAAAAIRCQRRPSRRSTQDRDLAHADLGTVHGQQEQPSHGPPGVRVGAAAEQRDRRQRDCG